MTQADQQQDMLQLAEPVVIVGLGKTGLSCARFLAARGIDFMIVDSRDNPPGLEALKAIVPATKIVTGEFKQDLFEAAGTLIVSPGVSVQQPLIASARERGASIIGDVELFARVAKVQSLR